MWLAVNVCRAQKFTRHISRHQLELASPGVFPLSTQTGQQRRACPVFTTANKLLKEKPSFLVAGTSTSTDAIKRFGFINLNHEQLYLDTGLSNMHITSKAPFALIAFHLAAISGGHLSPKMKTTIQSRWSNPNAWYFCYPLQVGMTIDLMHPRHLSLTDGTSCSHF